MKKIYYAALLAALPVLSACESVLPDPKEDRVEKWPIYDLTDQEASVDMNKTYQEMEGFGASDCWLPNTIGKHWTKYRSKLGELLFSQQTDENGIPLGIGLSMWRVNLGAGTAELGDESGVTSVNSRAESYLSASGDYNWNKCEGQRYFMEQAKNNNLEKFILFSNSPLVQFTKNGEGRSDNGGYANLKDDCYKPFAEYMAEVAKHFTDLGYNIDMISPVNEPQFNWDGRGQEGSGWQNSEIARLTRELDAALSARGVNTKISLGEATSWGETCGGDANRANTIYAFFDPASNAYVGNLTHVDKSICGHSYWTFDNWVDMRDVRQKVRAKADEYGLRVWQTEWSMLEGPPSELDGGYGSASEFDIAQYMSRIIHNDITVAGCTSWSYWTSMSTEVYSQKNRFMLIKTTPAGGNYSDDFTAEGSIEDTPNLWVLGNYSLFIRPGYKRVEFTHNESKDFFGSAYVSPDRTRLVVVITNYAQREGINLKMAAPQGTKAITTYTTSAKKKLRPRVFNPSEQVYLDPKSVTTIVYEL